MNVPPIFKDPELQAKFDKQGFITLPFLNEAEVKHMDALFDELHPNLNLSGFYSGSYSPDFDYKKRVSEEIKVVYKRRYEEVFQNYESFGGAYLCKMPSADSQLYVHQDWTVVDESKHVALNIWIPLCDITLENGPLQVVPGSHYNAYPVIRSPTLPQFFDNDVETAMEELETVIVKAGEAVILNQSLVHYSPPNRSNKIRKAITAGVKTKGAQMIFHYKDRERTDKVVEKFEMDDDFFIQFNDFFKDIFQRPYVGRSVGMVEYEVPVLYGEELRSKIQQMKVAAGYPIKYRPKVAEAPAQPINTEPIQQPKGFLTRVKELLFN